MQARRHMSRKLIAGSLVSLDTLPTLFVINLVVRAHTRARACVRRGCRGRRRGRGRAAGRPPLLPPQQPDLIVCLLLSRLQEERCA